MDKETIKDSENINSDEWKFLLLMMLMEDIKQKNSQWKSFEDELIYKNRFSVKHAVIDLGGNILLLGSKTDGSKYNIGIQKPFGETGEPITSIKVANKSVVTTGIYQRYFEADGKIYHHILDPRTGYPCENTLYTCS